MILDSVQPLKARYGTLFDVLEWGFTLLFSVEYVMRLASVRHPLRYATSFFGIVDLLAVLPTYLAFFIPEASALIDVRMLRLLRIFRILKLGAYVSEFSFLGAALRASRREIIVFIGFVLITVTILGTVMYLVEGPENGFTSIPVAIYWGITTMTTVGFGDIAPKTHGDRSPDEDSQVQPRRAECDVHRVELDLRRKDALDVVLFPAVGVEDLRLAREGDLREARTIRIRTTILH